MQRDYRKKITVAIVLLTVFIKVDAQNKSLVDFFLPMEPQSPLVSKGIWGNDNVIPRDTTNGLEDATLKEWCYWDGRIVKDTEGKYHLYASRWNQSFSHSIGWKKDSKAIHAVSNQIMGPYKDLRLTWPHWQDGKGHNVIGLKMHDGRYAMVTSEITPGDVFVSNSPDGPFKYHGAIQIDYNGYPAGNVRYNFNGHLSNVKILLRPDDGKYMIISRQCVPMVSDKGILGPYKILGESVYKKYPELPQSRNEDPTVWYSGGMYHIVYNHWPTKTSHHFTSKDGINDWKYRGIAFKKDETKIFKYTDGTINDWEFIERPTAYVENGHVTHFIFSVIDVHKGQDGANDNHASKIVVVPFDGIAFDAYMDEVIKSESKKN